MKLIIPFHFSADLKSLPDYFYNLLLNSSKYQCFTAPPPPVPSSVLWERTSSNYLLLFLWTHTLKVLTLPFLSHAPFVFPGALLAGAKTSRPNHYLGENRCSWEEKEVAFQGLGSICTVAGNWQFSLLLGHH